MKLEQPFDLVTKAMVAPFQGRQDSNWGGEILLEQPHGRQAVNASVTHISLTAKCHKKGKSLSRNFGGPDSVCSVEECLFLLEGLLFHSRFTELEARAGSF